MTRRLKLNQTSISYEANYKGRDSASEMCVCVYVHVDMCVLAPTCPYSLSIQAV